MVKKLKHPKTTPRRADPFAKMTHEQYNAHMFNRFPKFFTHKADMMTSLMGFGFAIDAGWRNIVYDLCFDIEHELQLNPNPDFEVTQVKSKFAGLRFYVSCASEKIFELISKAEKRSFETCETCGNRGKTTEIYHWYWTLCKTCESKKRREKIAQRKKYLEPRYAKLIDQAEKREIMKEINGEKEEIHTREGVLYGYSKQDVILKGI